MSDELLKEIIADLRSDNRRLMDMNAELHAALMAYKSESPIVQQSIGRSLAQHLRRDSIQDDVEQAAVELSEHRITKAVPLT
jgi:hypothetical protein